MGIICYARKFTLWRTMSMAVWGGPAQHMSERVRRVFPQAMLDSLIL